VAAVNETGWLLRDGDVLAAAERVEGFVPRLRGMSGQSGFEGALLLDHWHSAHTIGCVPSDIAFLDAELQVLAVAHLGAWRMAMPRTRVRSVLQTGGGNFERWRLAVGDRLDFRPAS